MGEAEEHLSRVCKRFARVVPGHEPYPTKFEKTKDPYRVLVRAVVYQQLSGKAAATIHGRVLALFPDKDHPEPEDLLATAPETLRAAGLSRQKIAAVKDVAQKRLDGIIPERLFPDTVTFLQPLYDCELLNNYFDHSDRPWDDSQRTAVSGLATYGFCTSNGSRYPNARPDNCDVAIKDALTVDAAGIIEPVSTVELKSKASGEVLEIGAETGDTVKRGALLVRIDPRTPRNLLAQAEAQLNAAQAQRSTARSQLERGKTLLASQWINQAEYDQLDLAVANAEAAVVAARVEVENARIALEDTEVCDIPLARLEQLSRDIPSLQQHFHRIMSREIVRDHGVMLLLGTMRAEERLAAFLLNLSQRFAARGYSSNEFYLRMTREEIGSYLGLKLETISRALSRFHEEQLIEVHTKYVRILDMDTLRRMVGVPVS